MASNAGEMFLNLQVRLLSNIQLNFAFVYVCLILTSYVYRYLKSINLRLKSHNSCHEFELNMNIPDEFFLIIKKGIRIH